MKIFYAFSAALILMAFPVLCEGATAEAKEPTPISFGEQHLVSSEIYGELREINVYVPKLPDWGKEIFDQPLPVLYLIDGGTDQDYFHIAGLAQLPLVNAERQPMIVVGIKTHNRRPEISYKATDPRYQSEFASWQTADGEDFRRHIETEVMPLIEANYKTGRKIVMGESLAGLFVMEVLLRNPDMFDDYVSISPSLWWDDRFLAKNAKSMLAKHKPSDRRLYVTMADEGGTMQKGLDEMLLALQQTSPKGLTVNYVDRRKEDSHSTIYHHSARDAFGWLFGIAPSEYGAAPWYLTEGAEPPAKE
ncbi:MAG: alpha/beta hydrolase-fold protein [Parasphingorhabdus sp.]|uniref:alpha/beta hydrolase n=2 Tax=Parasphingorhabdus sp. TaxID=2709688 RepID=UPI003264AF2F